MIDLGMKKFSETQNLCSEFSPRRMVFASTGRCGTRRLFEILQEHLPPSYFDVRHQLPGSRPANVLGNVLLHVGGCNRIREMVYRMVVGRECRRDRSFIITDPLTAMILPDSWIFSPEVAIVHIMRDDEGFARSMIGLSRSRRNSFIAHNFVPLWQPFLIPLQNALDSKVHEAYRRINRRKNRFFHFRYRRNPHYRKISMMKIFSGNTLERLIHDFFGLSMILPATVLATRSNASETSKHH